MTREDFKKELTENQEIIIDYLMQGYQVKIVKSRRSDHIKLYSDKQMLIHTKRSQEE